MNTTICSGGDGLGSSFNVAFCGTGKAANGRPPWRTDFAGNGVDGLEVARASEGEPGFDDVYIEAGKLPGDGELFGDVHGGPWGLLTVTQRRVENQHSIGVLGGILGGWLAG